MKMKKKLLSFVMVAMLVIPLAGIAGAGKVEAADVTDSEQCIYWEGEFEKEIPGFSDSFADWLMPQMGFSRYSLGDTQYTLGPNSCIKINWDKSTIAKEDVTGIQIRAYVIDKFSGEYDISYMAGEPFVGKIINHPSYWGGDANYTPSEPMNPEYKEAPWYMWEESYYLADWAKQDTFPGLNMENYYNEVVEEQSRHEAKYWEDQDTIVEFYVTYVDGDTKEKKAYRTFWLLDKPLEQYISGLKEPTESGEIEEVDLSKNESQAISKDDFDKLIEDNKEKDIVIKNKSGLSFTFPKGTLSAVEGKTEYDFGTTFVNEFAAGTLPEFVTASNFVKTISFGYSGKLPGKATIKIPLGAEYAGKTLYYSYVKESGLTETQQVTADAEGNITVTQDHCSDYVITTENPNPTQKSPQTGDNQNFSFLLILMVASAAIAGTIIMRKRTVK